MLDLGFHQAASLHSLTPQAELRLLAVASQGNTCLLYTSDAADE